MKKPLFILLFALAFVAAVAAQAQAEAPAEADPEALTPALSFPSSVGVFASSTLGGGLSYQVWFDRFGCALTIGGNALPYNSSGEIGWTTNNAVAEFYSYNYSIELDLMYRLYSSVFTKWLTGDLFAYATLAHTGGTQAVYVANTNPALTGSYIPGSYVPALAAGLGIGYEIILFKHFSIPAMFGYTAQFADSAQMPFRLDFMISGGLRYRF